MALVKLWSWEVLKECPPGRHWSMVKCAQAGPGSKPGDLCNHQGKAHGLRCLSLTTAKANEARQAGRGKAEWLAGLTTWQELPLRQSLWLLQTGNGTQHYTRVSHIQARRGLDSAGKEAYVGTSENGQAMSLDSMRVRRTMLTVNDFATRIWIDVTTFRYQCESSALQLQNFCECEKIRGRGLSEFALVIWQPSALKSFTAHLGKTPIHSKLICFKLGPVTVQWVSRTKRLEVK